MADDIVIGEKTPGARVFPNPNNIRPKADTDAPDVEPTSVKMDTSNPAMNQIEHRAEPHPLEKQFGTMKRPGKGYRHPVGGKVPASHGELSVYRRPEHGICRDQILAADDRIFYVSHQRLEEREDQRD
jgi:hypothetical protein